MNKLFILLLFLGLSFTSANASTCSFDIQSVSIEKTVDPVDKLLKNLNAKITLTAEQTQQIRDIAEGYNFKSTSGKETKKLRKSFRTKVYNEVLTPEQQKAFRTGRK